MAQIYLPGRTAEITDATMLVMLAIIMKLMRDVPERY
jgi:VanZ family protein